MFVITASADFLSKSGLKLYDSTKRKMRIGEFIPKELESYADSIKKLDYVYIYIPRAKDSNGHIHRLTPSFLLPFKHYCAEEVASCVCNECGQCTAASDSTIKRWEAWWHENWTEFKCKGIEIEKDEYPDDSPLVDAEETTLACKLNDLLGQTWLGRIMEEFSSDGLWAFTHRVRCTCPQQAV